MAVYTLDNISFDIEDDRIVASADILEDGALLQSFSKSFPRTTDWQMLARDVGNFAKNIVIHHELIANVFTDAEVWLKAQSWTYG